MDPNQAWSDLSQAVADEEWWRAAEIADGLLEWLVRGGFPPQISGNREFDIIVARSTAEAIASWEIV